MSACGDKNGSVDNSERTDVVVAMSVGSEPERGFDPIMGWGAGDHVHEPLIQSTLIATDTEMNFVNDLAVDYGPSDGGKVWTFTIRDDVKFTNGDPLTARDVVYTFNTIRNTDGAKADLSMIEDAVALDDTTVEIRLTEPNNSFLYTIAVIGIVPENAYDENYGENPIGSGRYMLQQWDKGQQVILVANPDYYGEAPKMDKVTVLFMEEDAALAAVKSGDADIVYTSAVYSNVDVKGYDLVGYASVDRRGISLPCVPAGGTKADGDNEYALGNDVTSDIAIRQAINYAVDRDVMATNVLNGYGSPCYSVCDGMPWASENIKVETDVEKAKQILADAGWVDTDGDGYVEKDGLKASFSLYYPASDSVRQAMAAEFTNQMAAIGIEVLPVGEDWDTIYQHEYSDPVLWGWGSNSPTEFFNLTYSTAWGNYASYDDAEVDALLEQAVTASDMETSYGYYHQAMEKVSAEGAASW
ncbi:MAG: ABC transporter substrate-binding protein, partial [Firmicutes bacterium]|nr:ABC transporter substrate-binding protein [Bacillota bacterium]